VVVMHRNLEFVGTVFPWHLNEVRELTQKKPDHPLFYSFAYEKVFAALPLTLHTAIATSYNIYTQPTFWTVHYDYTYTID